MYKHTFCSMAEFPFFNRGERSVGGSLRRMKTSLGRFMPILVVLAMLCAVNVGAQSVEESAEEQSAQTALEQLANDFKVMSSKDGWVVLPRQEGLPFGLLEIRPDTVLADGRDIDREQLEGWIDDDDAEAIFRLSQMAGLPSAMVELPTELEEQRRRLEELEEMRVEQLEELEALEEQMAEETGERRQRGVIRTDTRVSFGSGLTIEENEITRDVVVIGGSLDVKGKVRGDAVVIGGSVEVEGEVDGEVTSVGGSVSLGPKAEVGGEVISVGGAVYRDPESRIRGGVTELALAPLLSWDDFSWGDFGWPGWHWPGPFGFHWNDTFDLVGNTIFLIILMLILAFLGRNIVTRVADRAEEEPWKAGLVGLTVQILFFPVLLLVFIVLMVSVIGIPLALLLVPFSLFVLVLLMFVGYAGVAVSAGRKLQERFDWKEPQFFLLVIFGVLLIQGWSILGEALAFSFGPIKFTAYLLIVFGFLIKYLAWTVGLGAMVLHGFSPRAAAVGALPPTPPPPVPDEPGAWTSDLAVPGLGEDSLGYLHDEKDEDTDTGEWSGEETDAGVVPDDDWADREDDGAEDDEAEDGESDDSESVEAPEPRREDKKD